MSTSILALFCLCSESVVLNSSLCSISRCLHSEFVVPFFNRNTGWLQCRQLAVFEPCLPVCHVIFLKCIHITEWLLLSAADISEEGGWIVWDMVSNREMGYLLFGLNLIYVWDWAWYELVGAQRPCLVWFTWSETLDWLGDVLVWAWLGLYHVSLTFMLRLLQSFEHC